VDSWKGSTWLNRFLEGSTWLMFESNLASVPDKEMQNA